MNFKYIKKMNPGLHESRYLGIKYSSNEILLFLDDDIEMDKEYFKYLQKAFLKEDIGGFSGIDINIPKLTFRMLLYQLLFFHASFNIGKLSITGFSGSITRWPKQKKDFLANFYSGCNMAFRKKYLLDVPFIDLFRDYSLADDIYISNYIAHHTSLLVNPKSIVNHYVSETSRQKTKIIFQTMVVNHYYLLTNNYNSFGRKILFIWSIGGYILKDIYDYFRYFILGRNIYQDKIEALKGKLLGIKKLTKNPYSNIKKFNIT